MQRRTFLAATAAAGAMAAINPSLAVAESVNPLTQKWSGPFGGVPAFDKVKVADFKPALEAAMAKNLAEIDAITGALLEMARQQGVELPAHRDVFRRIKALEAD